MIPEAPPIEPPLRFTVLRGPTAPHRTLKSVTARMILGSSLFLPYLLLGWLEGCPGVPFRLTCARLGLQGLFGRPRIAFRELGFWMVGPLDSVRYFEFAFARESVDRSADGDYLDVSSPRLLPIVLLRDHPGLRGVFINPDESDLDGTRRLLRTLDLESRCRTECKLIADTGWPEESFDLVTSLSVLEHIPDDVEAIKAIWRLLRPGGQLVLTVPCAARPYEERADFNKYGILQPGPDQLTFWQRFYSPRCLESRIFPVSGRPVRFRVYGEVRPGCYDRNVQQKMRDPLYPIWREPWMMAHEWRYFRRIEDLPGIGVIGMVFRKD